MGRPTLGIRARSVGQRACRTNGRYVPMALPVAMVRFATSVFAVPPRQIASAKNVAPTGVAEAVAIAWDHRMFVPMAVASAWLLATARSVEPMAVPVTVEVVQVGKHARVVIASVFQNTTPIVVTGMSAGLIAAAKWGPKL